MEQIPFSGNSLRERLNVEFQVLSPVHIGTREGRLTALEFVAERGMVHVIDEQKLGRFLLERKLIEYFVQEVGRGPVKMAAFLKEKGRMSIPADLPKVTSISIPGGESGMQEFRPFTRDGAGKIYLPGSSLKGVFRTAVLYRMAKRDSGFKERISSTVDKKDDRELAKNKKRLFGDLQKEQMQSFRLPNGKPGPNEDFFRCLTVRDAYPTAPVNTRVIQVHFLSKSGKGEFYWSQDKRRVDRDLSLWVEALVSGSFSTELLWDNALFGEFSKSNEPSSLPVKNLGDLLDAVKEMNSDLVEEEKRTLRADMPKAITAKDVKEYLKRNGPAPAAATGDKAAFLLGKWYGMDRRGLIRVGFGSGMLSTTLALVLPPILRKKVRDACGSGRRPDDPAPKSRRVWRKSDTEILPMGWLSMKLSEVRIRA